LSALLIARCAESTAAECGHCGWLQEKGRNKPQKADSLENLWQNHSNECPQVAYCFNKRQNSNAIKDYYVQ